jgi:hypothetical protein
MIDITADILQIPLYSLQEYLSVNTPTALLIDEECYRSYHSHTIAFTTRFSLGDNTGRSDSWWPILPRSSFIPFCIYLKVVSDWDIGRIISWRSILYLTLFSYCCIHQSNVCHWKHRSNTYLMIDLTPYLIPILLDTWERYFWLLIGAKLAIDDQYVDVRCSHTITFIRETFSIKTTGRSQNYWSILLLVFFAYRGIYWSNISLTSSWMNL